MSFSDLVTLLHAPYQIQLPKILLSSYHNSASLDQFLPKLPHLAFRHPHSSLALIQHNLPFLHTTPQCY